MSVYAIGDTQGCFKTLEALLAKIEFDHHSDQAILLGDVINRGPASLELLRFVKESSKSIKIVLGNHDIFAIALYLGAVADSCDHTLNKLFSASDCSALIDWLRQQPLLRRIDNRIFVHAGILPGMSVAEAFTRAAESSLIIQGKTAKQALKTFFTEKSRGTTSDRYSDFSLNLKIFTLMRACDKNQNLNLEYAGPLENIPQNYYPWFALRSREPYEIYFGHWAALGFLRFKNYTCLDTGCAWGKKLSALRLDDKKLFQIDNQESCV